MAGDMRGLHRSPSAENGAVAGKNMSMINKVKPTNGLARSPGRPPPSASPSASPKAEGRQLCRHGKGGPLPRMNGHGAHAEAASPILSSRGLAYSGSLPRHTTSSPPPNAASPRSAYDAERTLTRAAHQYRSHPSLPSSPRISGMKSSRSSPRFASSRLMSEQEELQLQERGVREAWSQEARERRDRLKEAQARQQEMQRALRDAQFEERQEMRAYREKEARMQRLLEVEDRQLRVEQRRLEQASAERADEMWIQKAVPDCAKETPDPCAWSRASARHELWGEETERMRSRSDREVRAMETRQAKEAEKLARERKEEKLRMEKAQVLEAERFAKEERRKERERIAQRDKALRAQKAEQASHDKELRAKREKLQEAQEHLRLQSKLLDQQMQQEQREIHNLKARAEKDQMLRDAKEARFRRVQDERQQQAFARSLREDEEAFKRETKEKELQQMQSRRILQMEEKRLQAEGEELVREERRRREGNTKVADFLYTPPAMESWLTEASPTRRSTSLQSARANSPT
mmetsp:Transcript_32555/g.74382  ORF Transcript_32555/g.74382 Transcript_32555/m.74382 type:complete len:522 (-) Transcript_32555:44-1609(-)